MLLDEIAKLIIFVAIVSFIYILIRFIQYKKTNELNIKSELIKLIFISYIAALAAVLIIPKISMGIDDDNHFFMYFLIPAHSYNFRPFETLLMHLSLYQSGNPIGIINLFVNSCLFIPYPALLKLCYPKLKAIFCFLIPFISIFVFEFLQYFVGRASDIDDVILNTSGVLVGMLFLPIINTARAAILKAVHN